MNTIMLSFVMLNKVISIIYCLLYKSLSSCTTVLYINPESWPVVGFCPNVGSTGVFGINLSTLYPSFGSLKEVLVRRTRQSDYVALSLSLSHRSFTMGVWAQPLVLFNYPNLGAVDAWPGEGRPVA